MQFARNVRFEVKNGKEQEFAALFEKEVLPILRKQSGFQQGVTLVSPKSAIGISLWEDRKSAETYQNATDAQVLAKLTTVIDGTPRVETYENASAYLRA